MNSASACKNLTDGLVTGATVTALIGFITEFMSFEGEYLMNHPITREEIRVKTALDNPYASTYLMLLIAFLITAIVGFASKKSTDNRDPDLGSVGRGGCQLLFGRNGKGICLFVCSDRRNGTCGKHYLYLFPLHGK